MTAPGSAMGITGNRTIKTCNIREMKQIDFHAHILPGCDHGSDCAETSAKQLSLAAGAGIDVICAVPHFYPERENVEQFLRRRELSLSLLKRTVRTNVEILPGAEVLCFAGLEKQPGIDKLCFERGGILLLEMPFKKWPSKMIETVEALYLKKDFKVILAHVDRYPPDEVEELLSIGLTAQLNTDSCSGFFFDKRIAGWINDGSIVAWGSDIHGALTGYGKWKKCRKRRGKLWDAVMERTNTLLGF